MATVPGGLAGAPVLWNGGVAWPEPAGIYAAATAAGAAPREVLALAAHGPGGGLQYQATLDGAGGAAGPLAYGWEEANNMTPPMGPGDTNVPSPPIPYETAVDKLGVIAPNGGATNLPDCAPSISVSLAGATVAYLCAHSAAGQSDDLVLADAGAPGERQRTISGVGPAFQLSGDLLAYQTAPSGGTSSVVVENAGTGAVLYQVPLGPRRLQQIALQGDGTMVLLAQDPACSAGGSLGAEWFSPASPTAHALGCFDAGSLRPAGDRWIGLQPAAAAGGGASLVLVNLLAGTSRALATFPTAALATPTPANSIYPSESAAGPVGDFDGTHLTWVLQTCAGPAIQYDASVDSAFPSPSVEVHCPAQLRAARRVRASRRGVVVVRVVCPLGCSGGGLVDLHGPRGLFAEASYGPLGPSSAPATVRLRIGRRQRLAVARRRHVPVKLSAFALPDWAVGAPPPTSTAKATLTA